MLRLAPGAAEEIDYAVWFYINYLIQELLVSLFGP